jgi:hypothetical protein
VSTASSTWAQAAAVVRFYRWTTTYLAVATAAIAVLLLIDVHTATADPGLCRAQRATVTVPTVEPMRAVHYLQV